MPVPIDPDLLKVGPVGLLVLVFLALLFGWLVPLWTHRRELRSTEQRADEWRAAAQAQDARNDALNAQVADLTESAKLTLALVQALKDAGNRRRDDGGPS